MIAIHPKKIREWPKAETADRVDLGDIVISLGKSASALAVLGRDDGEGGMVEIVRQPVTMTPEQYEAWGTDDDYAINCLLKNLGLVRV